MEYKNIFKTPFVVVLILSYNGKHLLDDSVSSYLANDYSNFEVVVIDNGSTDDTKEYVEKIWPHVKVLRTEKNLKYSGGFNFGLKYAFEEQKADYVLITNNDVKADNKVISACVEIAERDSTIAFVTGKVYYYDQPDILQTVGKEANEKYWRGKNIGNIKDTGQYNKIKELSWCDDVFWLVSKKVFNSIRGYDTEFAFQSEDFEWQARAKINGFKIYYTPNAKIWHKESMTLKKKSPERLYYTYRNPLIVYMMYKPYSYFKFEFRNRRINLIKTTIISLFKLRVFYIYNCWKGHVSAFKWGIRNKKINLFQTLFLY